MRINDNFSQRVKISRGLALPDDYDTNPIYETEAERTYPLEYDDSLARRRLNASSLVIGGGLGVGAVGSAQSYGRALVGQLDDAERTMSLNPPLFQPDYDSIARQGEDVAKGLEYNQAKLTRLEDILAQRRAADGRGFRGVVKAVTGRPGRAVRSATGELAHHQGLVDANAASLDRLRTTINQMDNQAARRAEAIAAYNRANTRWGRIARRTPSLVRGRASRFLRAAPLVAGAAAAGGLLYSSYGRE